MRPSRSRYGTVVVGGGHNGLVCAAYLARAGEDVLVLERREVLGGAATTEELWPGYRVSSASYVVSLLQEPIVRELELERHGYHVYPIDGYFHPFEDGSYAFNWMDGDRLRREIARFSPHDAAAHLAYDETMGELVDVIRPLLLQVPPDPTARRPDELASLLAFALRNRRLRRQLVPLVDLMTMSADDFLGQWFEHDRTKVLVGGVSSVVGAWAGPRTPGTAYVLMHHVMGSAGGHRGGWGFVRGGMGALSGAIAQSARSAGAEVVAGAPVERVLVEDGRACGVVLAGGEEVRAERVVSNAHPRTTFLDLVGRPHLPDELALEIERYRTRSGVVKVNCAIAELPDFRQLPGRELGQQHPEFLVCESIDELETGFQEAAAGHPAAKPMLDCVIPSTKDPTLAPEGKHVLTMFVQYAPYELAEGSWEEQREAFGDRCIARLAEHAPNIAGAVEHRQVLAPPDLEERFGLVGGNIFHGEMTLDQMLFMRPALAAAAYATPLDGLYLCGSGTHPGGGVMGAPGHNAARQILRRELQSRRRGSFVLLPHHDVP